MDDEVLIRNALERETREWRNGKSLTVEHFDNPAQALAALMRDRSDVRIIISDRKMPDMDGLEFLRIVEERYPRIPALLLTGDISLASLNTPKRCCFLEKPWNHETLIQAIAMAYEKHPADKAE